MRRFLIAVLFAAATTGAAALPASASPDPVPSPPPLTVDAPAHVPLCC